MPKVLTTASTVLCDVFLPLPLPHHGGTVTTTSTAKLTVGGKPVLVASSLGPIPAPGGTPCATVVAAGETPCTAVVTVLPASVASKLTVGGSPVVLETLTGTTNGVPPGALSAAANQTTLTAV